MLSHKSHDVGRGCGPRSYPKHESKEQIDLVSPGLVSSASMFL